MKELWQPIPGYEGIYEASDAGRIRSVDRIIKSPAGHGEISYRRTGLVLSQSARKQKGPNYGRKFVNLRKEGKSHPTLVHHLVAFTFIGPRPEGLEIDHVNGDRTDNRADNLEYVTHEENVRRHNSANKGMGCRGNSRLRL